MKKKTLYILLSAITLMLVGTAIFFFSFFTQSTSSTPVLYTTKTKIQHIEIDLEHTNLTICPSEKTYIEIRGYHERNYFVSEKDGKLLLTDKHEKSPIPFKLSGIGQWLQESRQTSEKKQIILHLSQEHSEISTNLILKNSTLTLSTAINYLTLNAENSSITVNYVTFDRFNGKLTDCDSKFFIPYTANEFSRNIETHHTKLSLNGDERANAEQFTADFQKPFFALEAFGGSCHLEYSKETP